MSGPNDYPDAAETSQPYANDPKALAEGLITQIHPDPNDLRNAAKVIHDFRRGSQPTDWHNDAGYIVDAVFNASRKDDGIDRPTASLATFIAQGGYDMKLPDFEIPVDAPDPPLRQPWEIDPEAARLLLSMVAYREIGQTKSTALDPGINDPEIKAELQTEAGLLDKFVSDLQQTTNR